MSDLSKDLPKGNSAPGGRRFTGKVILGLAGVAAAGGVAYFAIKTASSTLTNYGNEAQQLFNQCSSTMTAERADYIKYLNQYLSEGDGNLTPAQLSNLKTIQNLMSSTAAQCTTELSNFCKQNPKECPTAPLPTLVNTLGSGAAIGEAVALSAVGAGLGAAIYKKLGGTFKKNPKAQLTGAGNRGALDNAVSQAKVGQGEVSPENAANYQSSMQDENVIVAEDLTAETAELNSLAEETVITATEEESIATAIDTEFQTTLDDFIALE